MIICLDGCVKGKHGKHRSFPSQEHPTGLARFKPSSNWLDGLGAVDVQYRNCYPVILGEQFGARNDE